LSSNITIVNITQLPDSTITFDFGGTAAASFKPSAIVGCAPLAVSFANQSVFSTTYSWDLGNGQISTLSNPVTTYTTPGTFNVSLVVYNENNEAKDTFTTTISVSAAPIASYTFTRDNNTITFTNTSKGADYYAWRFTAGGSSFNPNPTYTFTQPTGFYMVAYSNNGCTDTIFGNLWNTGLAERQENLFDLHIRPNPVKEMATLRFMLTQTSDVQVSVYNLLGQHVYSENYDSVSAGKQELSFSAKSISQPGIYIVKMKVGNQESTQRMLKQ
jgi:PKD repeat protein